MPQRPLFAKDIKYRCTLFQHLIDTDVAALAIFTGRILKNWCRFFQIDDPKQFLFYLRIACLFHDIGKANKQFQDLLHKILNGKQTLRHEWLSTLILYHPTVLEWLSGCVDVDLIAAAVLGHHLKANSTDTFKIQSLYSPKQIELFLNDEGVLSIFDRVGELIQKVRPAQFPEFWDSSWETVARDIRKQAMTFGRSLQKDPDRKRLVSALKAAVMISDAVASAQPRKGFNIEAWVNQHLHQLRLTAQEVEQEILQPLYEALEQETGQPFCLKPTQLLAKELGDRAATVLATGGGKTIQGYQHICSILERYELGRLLFLYPTRATANAGFADYTARAPGAKAALLHSSAAYELNEFMKTLESDNKDYSVDEALFALGHWGKRYFSATVDQFLSFAANNYGAICRLPILVDAAIVIDEVHAFDPVMWADLISVLQHFNFPVFLMSASIPPRRRQELEKHNIRVFPTTTERQQYGIQEIEDQPRYEVRWATRNEAIEAARQATRVLWVSNQVKACQEVRDDLAEAIVYHSRFLLRDRTIQEDEVLKRLGKQARGRAVVSATQTVEMSLDISCDLLVTDLALTMSLIQRFGRCNRWFESDLRQILVLEVKNSLPYTIEGIRRARKFMDEIVGQTVSQSQLSELLTKPAYTESAPYANGCSPFLDQGFWSSSESFRDIDGYSVSAILDKDLPTVADLCRQRQPIDEWIVPVPHSKAKDHEDRRIPKWLKVVPAEHYNSEIGFFGGEVC